MKPTSKILSLFGIIGLGVLTASTSVAVSKTKNQSAIDPVKYSKIVETIAPFKEATNEYPYMTPAQIEKIKEEIANQRSPAAGGDGGAVASPEFDALSKELLKISAAPRPLIDRPDQLTVNTDKLDAYLKNLEEKYESFKEPDTKLFASQLIPLRKLRGVVWKMIGLFEGRKTHPAHTLSLTAFKDFAGQLNIAFPDQSWEVGFDYLTQPYVRDDGFSQKFSDLAEFQGFLGNYYDAVIKAKDRLRLINVSDSGPVVLWDQKIQFGPKSFKDDSGRYKRIGTLEKHMLLSDLYFSLSQLAFMQAYSFNGGLDLSADFGWRFGIDGKFLAGVEGVTAKEMHDVLKSHSEVGIELPSRVAKVRSAIDHLRNAAMALELVWEKVKKRPGGGGIWLVDSGFIMRDQGFTDTKIKEFSNALNNKVTIKNKLTGEFTTLNIPLFYDNGGPKALSDLMPKEFNPGLTSKGDEWIPVKLRDRAGKVQTLVFRDYRKGSPSGWEYKNFTALFPDVKSNEDLKKAFRVFNSSFASFSSVKIFEVLKQ